VNATTFSTVSRSCPEGARRPPTGAVTGHAKLQGLARVAQRDTLLPQGTDSFFAGAAALVAALARSRRSRLGLRGAAARRPSRTPGTCHPWRASATTRIQHLLPVCAGVPGHQGDRHRSRVSADHPRGLPRWHLPGSGRSALPKPPPGMMGVSRNLSRAPTASLLDRLRRHLTEPARQNPLASWLMRESESASQREGA
jgi:hypothetical protein